MTMEGLYLLLDGGEKPLAKGKLLSPPGQREIRMRVLADKIDRVQQEDILHLVSMAPGETPLQARLLACRGDTAILERMGTLNPEVRRSLRIPVEEDTFLYPIPGRSHFVGRREARTIDLSCGGVAFYAQPGLSPGEQLEIVIPMTTNPVISTIQILRVQTLKSGRSYYTSKFVEMCRDEEAMICEAVFSIQLENRDQKSDEEREADTP